MNKMRKEFEAWAKKETNWDLHWSDNINQYMDHQTNGAWFAWQASSIPEGYVVVPKEPTKRMIDAGVDNTPETPSQDYWHSSQPLDDEQAEACYKAMIEAS